MKKPELIKLLVEEYGYSENDLKDKEGKPYTNAKLKAMVEAERQDAEKAEMDSNRVKVDVGEMLKDEDKIKVMSGTDGVFYKSDVSRKIWHFEKFGQIESIPYGELVTILNRFPNYFRDGLFIILDKRVQEEFNLTELYKNIITPKSLDELFEKDFNELETVVRNLPEGMKLTFINKVQEMYENKKLDSIRVVEMIENEFGFSLADNSPVSEIALKNTQPNSLNIIYVDKK